MSVHASPEGSFAIVESGATWAEVVRITLAQGLIPTVLTDYLGLSVGGTLSVGGVGAASFRYGVQAERVEALWIVTGTGELLRCSATEHRELFDAARAGLGQLGVIVQAQIPLVPAPSRARHYQIPYADIATLVADLDALADDLRFDQISAVGVIDDAAQWHFHIDAVQPFEPEHPPDDAALLAGLRCLPSVIITDSSYLEYCNRLDAQIAMWRESGVWQFAHPWVDVFVPDGKLGDLGQFVVSSTSVADLGTTGMLLIYPITTRDPVPLLPLPRGRAYLFDVLRSIPSPSPEQLDRLLHENRRIYDHALELGGLLYSISAVHMTPADWRRHYGARWDAFAAAKRRYDPDNLFGGSCRIFT